MLSGPGFGVARRLKEAAWAVVWKEEDTSCFRDFLLTFGLSASAEEAMAKVERRLTADPRFRRQHAGGTFYPVPIHMGVRNERRPGS